MSHAVLALGVIVVAAWVGLSTARRGSESTLIAACVIATVAVTAHVFELLLA